ncbi:MAG: hypothetical protein KKC75_08665 [Nanoarchaeota archaeon]|nr:hypothetical protein [Nanoarchaeota archaeon]MBU1005290.1 hypothetical protein [Nanoarchaeota archaeon]MBU1946221.1 hypothetical protein [Nanoarchaeota archaeon]
MADNIEKVLLTESSLRTKAAHMVALHGTNWEGIRRSEGTKRANQLLEEVIADETDKIASRVGVTVFKDNSFPGYGINYDNLSCFRGKGEGRFDMNYNLLRQIWYGMNYVEVPEENSGVPHEFLAAMNTFEILSLYRAFARLIEKSSIPTGSGKKTISIKELRELPAEIVISKMVGYGCRHQAISTMRQRGWNYFPTGRGDLIKRIKPFGYQLKDRFMKLLHEQKRTTELTEKRGQYPDFHDHCYDGKDARMGVIAIKGYPGRKKYTSAIASFMQGLYSRNIGQQK